MLLAVDLYPDGGGISAIVENSVEALRDDYDVHVAIVDERAGRREHLALADDHVHVLGHRPLLKPYIAPTSLLYPLRTGAFLRGVVGRVRPVALLVQDGLFLPMPGLIATRGRSVKLAVMDHGTLTNSLDPVWHRDLPRQMPVAKSLVYRLGFALDRPWRELRWRLGFRYADGVWYVGEELKPLLGLAGSRARQYKQPAPRDFLPATAEERHAARADLGLAPTDTVVNMATRFAMEKGLPNVLDAVARVAPLHPEVRLVVAGHGPLEGWLRSEIKHRGLERMMILAGSRDRRGIQRLHHASDFHLYAGTIGCGMSLALLEAMACGVVPIVSDVPRQHRELAVPSGWVFAAGSTEELTESLGMALACSRPELDRRRAMAVESLRAYAHPSVKDLVDELTGR